MKKRALFICGASESVINFRKELIFFLYKHDYEVLVIMGDKKRADEIDDLGIKYCCLSFDNRGINFFKKMRLVSKIRKVIRNFEPDLVFTFQATANIFGAVAAEKEKISKIFSMVEGLGDPFQPTNFKEKMVQHFTVFLYRKSLKNVQKVFFLNNDDKTEFIKRKIVKECQAVIIKGIGVNTDMIVPKHKFEGENKVVCLARLIKNKGILEYCEIAKMVRSKRNDISFELYGQESQLKMKDIEPYILDGSIKYCGYTINSLQVIGDASILGTCSFYREGFPMVILEAMALGKPVIAYNSVGNRDAVIDGKTGYLIPVHNIKLYAQKLIELIDNKSLMLEMGKTARGLCEKEYNSNIINNIIFSIIDS